MTDTIYPEPSPEQAALMARVRKMMLIAGITTAVAIGAVLVAIGYRLFTSEGSVSANEITARLPKGSKIYATAVAGDRLVLMLDVNGQTEIRTFDAHTPKTAGSRKFTTDP